MSNLPFSPPAPRVLNPLRTAEHWSYDTGLPVPPAPDISTPSWLRGRVPGMRSEQVLVAFRTLLLAEAMPGVPVIDQREGQTLGSGTTMSFCLPSSFRNDRAAPSAQFNSDLSHTAPELPLLAAWFSTVHVIAELAASACGEIERGALIAGAALARTALETAEQFKSGLEAARIAQDGATVAEALQLLLLGETRPSQIGTAVNSLVDATADETGWYDHVYKVLCDVTHPERASRQLHLAGSERATKPAPPLQIREDWLGVGRTALGAVVVACETTRRAWTLVQQLRIRLRNNRSTAAQPFLRVAWKQPTLAAWPHLDLETAVPRAIAQALMVGGLRTDDDVHLRASEFIAAALTDQFQNCSPWLEARWSVLEELQRRSAAHLARGHAVSAGAINRFALEHLSSLSQALRAANGDRRSRAFETEHSRADERAILEALRMLGAADGPTWGRRDEEAPTVTRQLRNGLNALTHPSKIARSMNWRFFYAADGNSDVDLEVYGHAKYLSNLSSDGNYQLDQPWSANVAALLVVDDLLVLSATGSAHERLGWPALSGEVAG